MGAGPSGPSAESVMAHARAYLAMRATTRAHLARLLTRGAQRAAARSGVPVDADALAGWVSQALDAAVRDGLLDDAAWSASRAARLARRGTATSRIRARLAERGVGRLDVDAAVGALGPDANLDAARALVRRRRLGPWRPEADRASRHAADLGVLARAGFSYDVARRALAGDDDGP
ncbi:MAG: hypothetical protein RLZZ299_3114 [Pseudomonadota bacterium]|jgi:regulatory protein